MTDVRHRVQGVCGATAALCALLLLAGCRTGGGWTPADPGDMVRLPAQSTGRWGSTTEVRFDDYTADSVKISWAHGSGHAVQVGRVDGDQSGSRQEYRFSLATAAGARIPVSCHSPMSERNVGFRAIEVRTSARYTYDCSIQTLNWRSWKLSLVESGDDEFAGALTTDGSRLDVRTQMTGNRVTGRHAEAYELHDNGALVATVDPRSRAVWLPQSAAAGEQRDAVAAAAVALLIYQRPTQH